MELWHAIKYVSSSTTLVAFVVAAVSGLITSFLERDIKLISKADARGRERLIAAALEKIRIDTGDMSTGQKLKLAIFQLRERRHRLVVIGVVAVAIVVVFGITFCVALERTKPSAVASAPPLEKGTLNIVTLAGEKETIGVALTVDGSPLKSPASLSVAKGDSFVVRVDDERYLPSSRRADITEIPPIPLRIALAKASPVPVSPPAPVEPRPSHRSALKPTSVCPPSCDKCVDGFCARCVLSAEGMQLGHGSVSPLFVCRGMRPLNRDVEVSFSGAIGLSEANGPWIVAGLQTSEDQCSAYKAPCGEERSQPRNPECDSLACNYKLENRTDVDAAGRATARLILARCTGSKGDTTCTLSRAARISFCDPNLEKCR